MNSRVLLDVGGYGIGAGASGVDPGGAFEDDMRLKGVPDRWQLFAVEHT